MKRILSTYKDAIVNLPILGAFEDLLFDDIPEKGWKHHDQFHVMNGRIVKLMGWQQWPVEYSGYSYITPYGGEGGIGGELL